MAKPMHTGMRHALRRQLSSSYSVGNEHITPQIPRSEIAKVLADLGLYPTYLSIVNERHFYQNKVLMEYANKDPHPVLLRQLAGYGRALTRQKILHSANFVRLELPIRLALRIRDLQRLPFNIVDNFHLTQIYENYYRLFDIFRRLPPVTKYDQNDEFCTMLSLMLDDNVLRLSHLMMGALEVSLLTEFTPAELDTFMSSMIRSRISRRLIIEEHISLSRSFEAEPHHDLASKPPDYIGEIFKDCHVHDTLMAVSEVLKDSLVQLFPDRDRMPDLIIDGDVTTRIRFLSPHLQYLFSEILRNSYEATLHTHGKKPGMGKLPPIRITIVNDGKQAIFRISDQGGGMSHEKLANIWSFYKTPDMARGSLDSFHQIPGLELYANLEAGSTRSLQQQAQPFSNTALAEAVTKIEGDPVHNTLHNLMVRPANYKLGLGLPMCKVYADYWNGDLSMNSLEGLVITACAANPKEWTPVYSVQQRLVEMVVSSISSLIHNDDLPIPQSSGNDSLNGTPAASLSKADKVMVPLESRKDQEVTSVSRKDLLAPAMPLDDKIAPSVPLRDLVSRFQVPLSVTPDPSSHKASIVPKPVQSISPKEASISRHSQANATLPALVVSDYIKRFTTDFSTFPEDVIPQPPPASLTPLVPVTISRSGKNSVKSLLNADDTPARQLPNTKPAANPLPATTANTANSGSATTITPKKRAPAKRKPTESKPESLKRSKTDLSSASTPHLLTDLNKPKSSDSEKISTQRPLSESKKNARSNKKSVDPAALPDSDNVGASTTFQKPELSHLSTTELAPVSAPPILPSPSVIDVSSGRAKTIQTKEDTAHNAKPSDEKPNEQKQSTLETTAEKAADVPPPIIALSIPLLDPTNHKPGKAEVIVNVLKLIEDKYGWSAVHPKATSAFEMMDDLIDEDEDENDNDEENETEVAEEDKNANHNSKRKKEGKEFTEEQLVRQHESRMNRKVGKYDYEDPFIDDEELQMEEEIASTKEGFFVYWGPLVDDRNNTSKKGSMKAKK